jgi:conjugal transfer/type IV secretion protein DotA/TraY
MRGEWSNGYMARLVSMLVLVVGALSSSLVYAQTEAPPEGRDLLKMVFGVDPRSFATLLTAPDASMLATISFTANVIAALVAAIFFLYHGVVFAIRAASSGEANSQRDGVWVFSRAAVALMFCAPLVGGYSFLQILLIWFAGLGSSLADTAWAEVRDVMSAEPRDIGSGPWLDKVVATHFDTNVSDNLALSMTCLAAAGQVYADTAAANVGTTGPHVDRVWGIFVDKGQRVSWTFGGQGGANDLPRDVCGSLSIMLPEAGVDGGQLTHAGYAHLSANLPTVVENYKNAVAAAALEATTDRRIATGDAFAEAERQFRIGLAAVVREAMASSAQLSVQLYDETMRRVEPSGWVGAGAVYLAAAQYERSVASLVTGPLQSLAAEPPTARMPFELEREYAMYRHKVMASIQQRRDAKYGTGDTTLSESLAGCVGLSEKSCIDGPARVVWQMARDMLVGMAQGDDSAGDPLAQVQRFGQGAFAVSTATLTLGGVSNVFSVAEAAGAALIAVGFALLTVGIMLGFYLPMMPMILWVTGLLMWLVSVAQMVLAAPIWGVLHAAGEGDGVAGNRAQLGYQAAFSIFARPILMLAGLFAGLLIARIGLGVAGYIFGIFGDTLMDGIANPVAGLVIVVIMAFALVALARFAFSMIYTVPDWVQRLVGAHEMGEGMQEQSLRSAVSGLSSELKSFTNSFGTGSAKRAAKG